MHAHQGTENRGIGQVSRPIPRNLVRRARLLDRLDGARDAGVFLVCAPAGYGKSLTVASWLADRGLDQAAWASLGGAASSPSRVWTTVIDAVALAAGHSHSEELDELSALAVRAPAEVPARLAEWARSRSGPQLLVLDDVQEVTSAVTHEQLVELARLSSGSLHLIVLSRHEPPWPLHRMRLEGLLQESRTADLTFDLAEATQLFDILGVPLDPSDVQLMVEHTEGWAAGLRLAALGLSAADDPHEYVLSISGRSGYIADYLMREVYAKLPARWRDLLQRISVVDEVCPELAEALGCGPESADLLAEMARANAFVVELGHRLGWYRLHPLLLDFVRSRATDQHQQIGLHREAAEWFRGQSAFWPALRHAVRAKEWSLAAELVGANVVTWTVRRPPAELREVLREVPREASLTYPGLAIGEAAALAMAGRSEGIAELVEAAHAQMHRTSGRRRRRYELLLDLIGSGNERWNGDLEAMLARLREIPVDPAVLSSVGLADWAAIRTLVMSNTGMCELWIGHRAEAGELLAQAATDDLGPQIVLPVLNARAHLAYLHWADGDLARAEELAQGALSSLSRAGIPHAVQASAAYLALAGVALDRNEQAEAEHWLGQLTHATAEPHIVLVTAMMRARALVTEGRLYDASTALCAQIEALRYVPLPETLVARAERLAEDIRGHLTQSAAAGSVVPAAAVTADPTSVRSLLERELVTASRAGIPESERLDALEQALRLAEPMGLVGPFLARQEVVRPLLPRLVERGTACPELALTLSTGMSEGQGGGRRPGMFIPLTEKEMNILRYLASSLSAAEIADALYVSINTVKTHQRAVHQKLGASSRREAVNRARELGLL